MGLSRKEIERGLAAVRPVPRRLELWAAIGLQALRSRGNVRASQGRTDDAIKIYRRGGAQYGGDDWEVLEAWKSAGDLLWDAVRHTEAREFYQHIVDRFDKEDAPSVYKIVVRASKRRLEEQP